MRPFRNNLDNAKGQTAQDSVQDAVGMVDNEPNSDEPNEGFSTRSDEWVDKLQTGPMIKYMGLSLLLVYHYVLWFVPDSFFGIRLLSTSVTTGWLVNLATVSVTMIAAAFFAGRKHHLSDKYVLVPTSVFVLVVSAFCLQYLPGFTGNESVLLIFSAINGIAEGFLLIIWGEMLTRIKAHFSTVHIGCTFGASLIVCSAIATVLPSLITPCLTVLIATISGIMLIHVAMNSTQTYPKALPRKAVKPAIWSVAVVCVVVFFTSAVCYYLIAIIPWEPLSFGENCFTFGSVFAGAIFCLLSFVCHVLNDKKLIFKLFPHILVLAVVAFVFFLAGYESEKINLLNGIAFVMSLTVSTMLEVSMIMYFGVLVRRGFFAPAISLAAAVGSTRLGIMVGNGLAIYYEGLVAAGGTPPIYYTALVCIVLLAVLLVPMSKREFHIVKLTSAPAAPSEIDVICEQIIEEFKLSGREGEILILISQGNTAGTIASKLVISPHTVNTHIRHIYEKVGIHKRSELLEYINMRKSD